MSLAVTEPSVVAEVERLLYRHDPVGIAFGDNSDEYRPEAETIAARLPGASSVDDVRTLVHEEFVRWFDDALAGPADRYAPIARELWAAWNVVGSNDS